MGYTTPPYTHKHTHTIVHYAKNQACFCNQSRYKRSTVGEASDVSAGFLQPWTLQFIVFGSVY